jgi:hypothetical protein
VAGVPLEFLVAETAHRPVLPNPPAPRAVSASASTSTNFA